MVVNALSFLVLFGITVIVGYVGSLIFLKTKIPDLIWLIIFGFSAASFGFVDRALFLSISPLLAALAILLILFDSGLNLDFYQMIRGFPRSIVLAVVGMILSTISVAVFAIYFLKFSLLEGLLLGAILGGTSSATVMAIVSKLKMKENIKTILTLDSVITDPLVIVVSIVLINMLVGNGATTPVKDVLSAFSIGGMVGIITGFVWVFVLEKLKGKPFDYMLTIAMLFLIYAFVESSGGSGAIAALFFGLVIGNSKIFSSILRFKKKFSVEGVFLTFQNEISFFIRSFFFVFLGIIITIKYDYIIYGIAIAAILIIFRVLAVEISSVRMKTVPYEKNIMRIMVPRDLTAAVIAQLPFIYGMKNAAAFSNIVFIVIVSTVIYTSVLTMVLKDGHQKKEGEKKEENKVKRL
ncbi:MAG: cation:proton antiporter [Candidatus Aenigmarchaeota archaeon]|nr:cation:proton antiporter [Candidatus Aenigmarchaeota archaeon]MDI6722440.1 cation:proton antiporter [Candidatus Aenigmarchaeota archaeon]